MKKTFFLCAVSLIVTLAAFSAQADDQSGRIGIGIYSGPGWLWQGSGNILITEPAPSGEQPLSDAGMLFGGKLRVVIAPEFAIMFSGQYGSNEYLGVTDPQDTTVTPKTMKTMVAPFDICAVINLAPEFKLNPYLMFGGGFSYWKATYPDSAVIGDELKGSFKFGGGLEIFMSDRISLDVLLRYSYIFTNLDIYPTTPKSDPDQVNGVLDLHVGLNFYLGGQRDTDGDGILNKQDKCPSEPEDFDKFEDEDGCPDNDNDMDGIPDKQDKCPNEAEDIDGFEDHDGCVDKDNDNDGVPDKLDKCPSNAEDKDKFEDEDGCPDEDNDQDGVLDINDRCPNEPEDIDNFEDYDGCPDLDNDKDGVVDAKDKCNNTPAGVQVDENGCPLVIVKDTDEDGILDENDKCPTMKEDMDGFEDMDGCPDLDNDQDGILDANDKCPNDAEDFDGYKDQDGCVELDNDNDGIPDKTDKCPGTDDLATQGVDTKENYNSFQDEDGCPDEKPKEIQRGKMILRGVNFESGSAALTPDSYPILDQVYESMVAYPEVKVEIRGYTDNRGSYELNLDLSRRRAETVMNYLVNRGIDTGRIKAKGFGPADPIASNNTESGRAQNRRIEFQRVD
jgi:outer membrane protein OmpA-like peptidoglycan-associated protein